RDRVAGQGAQLFAQAVVLLALAAAAEQRLQRRLAAELGQIAEAHDAILGEASEQRLDVPRHEQRLDMGDEGARLVDRLRIAAGHAVLSYSAIGFGRSW